MNSVSTLNTGQMNTTYREPLPARLARGLIRIISELVTLSVITFFLLMFLYASWSIYDAQRIFSGADTTVYETYKPESDVDDSPTFQELVAINPDVLGWITVYGTGIDYPLVQGETNDSYINTSVEKKFSLSGSIFLDSANEPDFSDFNTVVECILTELFRRLMIDLLDFCCDKLLHELCFCVGWNVIEVRRAFFTVYLTFD